MHVEFLVENLEKHLPLLTKALSPHTQIPVLANLLIEAKTEGLYISATDLELGIQIKVPAKILETGAVTIPGKQFIEVVNSLPKGKVDIVKKAEQVTVTAGDNTVVFQTIPKEEFPNLFEERGDKVSEFSESEFRDIFSRIVFAVSLDESRPELTGVFIFQKVDAVDFVATDGYRLSRVTKKMKRVLEEGSGLIVSSRLIHEALSLKTKNFIAMHVYKKGNQVLFESEDVVIVGRLIDALFPPYEKVIPESSKTTVTVAKEELAAAVKLAAVFARESANIVSLKIADNRLRLSTKSSGVGEGEAVVDVIKKGDDNEIAFNIKYVQDLLRNTEAKQVVMEVNSGVEPAKFTVDRDTSFLHIIMPVRIQD